MSSFGHPAARRLVFFFSARLVRLLGSFSKSVFCDFIKPFLTFQLTISDYSPGTEALSGWVPSAVLFFSVRPTAHHSSFLFAVLAEPNAAD